mmetsp:Transcript_43272/g.144134  ORF Transcript_43272/g.144134 Transcript_43272/m.144134 type:complete len:106 (+) Transcript_43272:31-348(+)
MPAVQHLTAQALSPPRGSPHLSSRTVEPSATLVTTHSRVVSRSFHWHCPLARSSHHIFSFHRAQERADVSSFLRAHAKDLSRACGTDKELAAFVDSFRRRWYWPF